MHKQCLYLTTALMAAATVPLSVATANATQADAVTLYNNGPAVVQQSRAITLHAGLQQLAWPVYAPAVVAESLWLSGDGVTLAGAAVPKIDDSTPAALLAGREGQTVTLLSTDSDAKREAILVSSSGSTALVRVDGRLEWIGDNSGWRIAWPAPQQEPGLQLMIRADSGGEQPVTLVYQRPGLNWHAAYTARLDADDGILQLQSQAVINNDADSPVQADAVTLVAGAVARVGAGRPQPQQRMMAAVATESAAPQAEAAGGYYRYRLDQPLDLAAGDTRLMALISAQTIDVKREYRVEGGWYRTPAGQRTHARMQLTFDNTTGQPLPAGPIRVYDRQTAMLLGEDRLGNMPDNAPVQLALGRAFDITAERRITHSSKQEDERRRSLQITLYNARDGEVTVTLAERLPEGAAIVEASEQHTKRDATEAEWRLAVPAHGKTTLSYSIRWQQ